MRRFFLFFSLLCLSLISEEIRAPKIAMFFAGRVKCYEEAGRWIKEFIQKHSVDVFCSINSELDEYHQKFIQDFSVKRYNFEPYKLVSPPTIRNLDCTWEQVWRMSSMF